MLRQEFIHTLHVELQTIAKHGVVLLGGSYVYGESTSQSDVDFFLLCPTIFIYRARQAIRAWKIQHSEIKINVMVVSRMAFQCGWYYVYGRTVSGELVAAPLNKAALITSALKLAYFNYIRYLAEIGDRTDALQKIAQKIAIIELIKNYDHQEMPPLGTSRLLQKLPLTPPFGWVSQVLEAKAAEQQPPTVTEEQITATLEKIYIECREYLSFSWSTYCRYNLKFLLKGQALFLWHNPDTMILQKIRQELKQKNNLVQLVETTKEYIFPVIIL